LRELGLCHEFSCTGLHKIETEEGITVLQEGEDLSSPEGHQKRLEVLNDEMSERKRLEDALQVSKRARDELEGSIETSRTFLAGLPEQLRLIENSSRPLQSHFGEMVSEKREFQKRAKDLPKPLYVLFRQLDALCIDDRCEVEVVDSVRISAHPSSSSDQAEDEEPKERKRSKSSKAYKDRGAESDLEVDELAVLLKVRVVVGEDNDAVSCTVRFQLLKKTGVLTVESETGLVDLFPGDSGRNFPLSGADISYPTTAVARPYMWAQWLGGLCCLPQDPSLLETSSRAVMERLSARVRTAVLLENQLKGLARLPSSIPVHNSADSLFPPHALAPKLTAWAQVPFSEGMGFFESSTCQEAETDPALGVNGLPEGRIFKAQFKGSTTSHDIFVWISESYPDVPSRLALRAAPETSKAQNSLHQDLKEIEVEVNAHFDELMTGEPDSLNWLVSHQVARAQMLLGKVGTPRAHKAQRGRNRRQAFAFNVSTREYYHR